MSLPLLDLDDVGLRCPACQRRLAAVTVVRADGEVYVPIAQVIDGRLVAPTDDFDFNGPVVGARVTLAAGLVNAQRRHPDGPWFAPGKIDGALPRATLPLVITCHCGTISRRPKLWLEGTPQPGIANRRGLAHAGADIE